MCKIFENEMTFRVSIKTELDIYKVSVRLEIKLKRAWVEADTIELSTVNSEMIL
jgi:hypothetical protein